MIPKFSIMKRDGNMKKQDPIKYLIDFPGLWRLNEQQRADVTISCKDTGYIPKVKDAGEIKKIDGHKIQIMHNGLRVVLGGYHGDWMARIIKTLNGHHEPQEEMVFYEVIKRIKNKKASMIELGSFWAYYSLWFNKSIQSPLNICCEPDPNNITIGRNNAAINHAENIHFLQGAAGSTDGRSTTVVMDSNSSKKVEVPIRTVDSLCREYKINYLDILHMDIQGFELSALEGAIETIESNKVRFVFISTHHYFFSGKANTHQECLHFLKQHGAHIVSSHTVAESFSGDGLIVASFSDKDKDFTVETSLNHTDNGLFRSYEEDLALLADLYRKS